MSSNERVANRLERLYARVGAGDQMQAMISVGGHGYRTDIHRAVFEFFNRHLKADARPVTDPDSGLAAHGSYPINPSALRVFANDSDLPKDQLNTRIDETFVPRPNPEPPSPEGFVTWRRNLLDRLRQASFAAWPAQPADEPRSALGDRPVERRESTEEGIEVSWRWLPGQGKKGLPAIIVLNPDEEYGNVPGWARDLVGNDSVLLLSPRGVGPVAWTRHVFPTPLSGHCRSWAARPTVAESGT
jgi:hypothetical protein